MKRILTLSLVFLLLLCTACANEPVGGAEATSTPVAQSETTPTPEPTDDPTAAKAKQLAAQHGLSEDELGGEYDLFVRFSETVEANEALGAFRAFVYRIFPVIADNADLVNEEYLFAALRRLSIHAENLGSNGNAGEFNFSDDSITLDTNTMAADPHRTAPTLFHELMHFLDYTLSGEILPLYLLDGKYLYPSDTANLSSEDFARKMACAETNFITEGGAEYFTCKYLSGTVGSYFKNCAFLIGLEYLYGEEYVRKLYFSRDSDALFSETLFEAGFSEKEYQNACETLNWNSRALVFDEPASYFAPEDILIRLYEYKRGDGWKEDEIFLYLFKYMDGIDLNDYRRSQHADFLETILFTTWGAYDRFEKELLTVAPAGTDLQVIPPVPVFRDGKLFISAYATVTDEESGEKVPRVLIFTYDFDNHKPLKCEEINTQAIWESYYGT